MGFPQILLELKNQHGYTNAYIGNACGVSEGAVRTWLSGKKAPSSNAIKSLSDLFGVSADFLIGGETKEKVPTEADAATLTQKERQIVERFPHLNDEGKTRVAEYMDDLITGGRYAPDRDENAPKTYRIAARSGNNVITMSDEEKERFLRSTEEALEKPVPDDLI